MLSQTAAVTIRVPPSSSITMAPVKSTPGRPRQRREGDRRDGEAGGWGLAQHWEPKTGP